MLFVQQDKSTVWKKCSIFFSISLISFQKKENFLRKNSKENLVKMQRTPLENIYLNNAIFYLNHFAKLFFSSAQRKLSCWNSSRQQNIYTHINFTSIASSSAGIFLMRKYFNNLALKYQWIRNVLNNSARHKPRWIRTLTSVIIFNIRLQVSPFQVQTQSLHEALSHC